MGRLDADAVLDDGGTGAEDCYSDVGRASTALAAEAGVAASTSSRPPVLLHRPVLDPGPGRLWGHVSRQDAADTLVLYPLAVGAAAVSQGQSFPAATVSVV